VQRGFDLVVAEANLRFLTPARFDDELALRLRIARLGETSITTGVDIVREDDLLVQALLRHVCISTATWGKSTLPDWVRTGLASLASADA
jgi:acyl-CoA thioester hydrolase